MVGLVTPGAAIQRARALASRVPYHARADVEGHVLVGYAVALDRFDAAKGGDLTIWCCAHMSWAYRDAVRTSLRQELELGRGLPELTCAPDQERACDVRRGLEALPDHELEALVADNLSAIGRAEGLHKSTIMRRRENAVRRLRRLFHEGTNETE